MSLAALLSRPGPVLLGGAHDALGAILAREAGFGAVWASGFEISASHGVPDANILTMSDHLRATARMVEAVDIPVVADCDNGFGNAINVIHTVRAYEREGVAALCIEDNVFPKRCSFYTGVRRELADPLEHAGKIQACVDTRSRDDLLVIARTEALIAGHGMDDALRRADLYADAGADALLIHSKAPDASEVLEFARRFERELPLVCVPTTYADTPVADLAEAGYRMIIFANQGLRAAVRAVRATFARMLQAGCISAADELLAPLSDVYELIGVPQMKADERSYLPAAPEATAPSTAAVVLAAGQSPELGELTEDRPKAMLDIKGKPLLERQADALRAAGVGAISVVAGWRGESVALPGVRTIQAHGSRGEVASLMAARDELRGPTLVLYGDILFDPEVAARLLRAEGDVVLVVDRAESTRRRGRDLVRTRHEVESGARFLAGERSDVLEAVGTRLDDANGEWIGMLRLSPAGAGHLLRVYEKLAVQGLERPLHESASVRESALTDLLQAVVDDGVEVRCIDIYKGWTEINSFEDYRRAWAQVR